MQQDRKTERRLLFMITAGTLCQMTSHSWYSWCVAVLTLLATGAQGQDIDTPWDPNDMPVDKIIITSEVSSP